MNNYYLNKLEYNKILEILSNYSSTYIGKDMCLNLLPSNDKQEVKEKLEETKEAVDILYRSSTPPITDIADNTINIKIIESNNTLSIKAILDLTKIFDIANELKKYFYTDYIKSEDYPILDAIFSKLYTNLSIIEKVRKSIIDENTNNRKST